MAAVHHTFMAGAVTLDPKTFTCHFHFSTFTFPLSSFNFYSGMAAVHHTFMVVGVTLAPTTFTFNFHFFTFKFSLLLRYGSSPPYLSGSRGDIGMYNFHLLFENGSYALFRKGKEVKFKD